MCRHLAYLGPPATLRSVLIDPPHGLYRQAWAPRRMRHGTVNADGFGVGWYADGDPTPARYRRAVPIWADESLPDIARVTRSRAVLAAVRNATPGMAGGEQAAAPFRSGRWLFSHNGVLAGWPGTAVAVAEAASAGQPVSARGIAASLLSLEAMMDSAFLWALTLERLRQGDSLAAALAATVGAVEAAGATRRFNFLLTDGESIAATAYGDSLWYRRSTGPGADGSGMAGSVVVASEPGDDEPGWTEVPDRHLLTATTSAVSVRPLAERSDSVPAGTAAVAAGRPLDGRTDSTPVPNAPNSLPALETTSATKGSVTG